MFLSRYTVVTGWDPHTHAGEEILLLPNVRRGALSKR